MGQSVILVALETVAPKSGGTRGNSALTYPSAASRVSSPLKKMKQYMFQHSTTLIISLHNSVFLPLMMQELSLLIDPGFYLENLNPLP